ncbi:hypothetical protein K469DRAFT_712815 [Zopfia rhizophila CBS 207.26]|uniref:Uncharacterized protein n=1 Tax=Zopfia rhizophila CBS 207.26 TaxID=1314779 RepID=A0A6A6DWZ8_9PEZI|nr:hypothetical protein K469DRAFT_712815 [Zopfia rhizophila CBS 207.26]
MIPAVTPRESHGIVLSVPLALGITLRIFKLWRLFQFQTTSNSASGKMKSFY